MGSFFRGDLPTVLENLGCRRTDVVFDVVDRLLEVGLLDALQLYEGYAEGVGDFRKVYVHPVGAPVKPGGSGEEEYCPECGVLQGDGNYYCVGCGGILPPPAEPPAKPVPPKPVDDGPSWLGIERLDISMHK